MILKSEYRGIFFQLFWVILHLDFNHMSTENTKIYFLKINKYEISFLERANKKTCFLISKRISFFFPKTTIIYLFLE